MGLVLTDVRFSYGDRLAIRDASCAFEQGRVTGLIGPNGSGKTTLVQIASGELRPSAGAVLFGGRPVRELSAKRRAQRIAVVPQRANLEFDFTVLDMVLMGRQPHLARFEREGERDLQLAHAAMEALGIAHLQARNARALSGGEWQRVLIARALCQDTDVLLLDEPVSSLDIRHQMEVLAVIRNLARDRGVTVAVVLHDLNLAAHYCDSLVLMDGGAPASLGSAAEVLTSDAMRKVYGIEARIEQDQGGISVRPIYL